VLQVFNSSNTIVAEYTYDSWGNILSATGTQASINPFRYRGYYYDEETGFYYLQSRYYDPEVGRFINADALVSTGQGIIGFNMFVYCLNNPVNMVDYTGCLPQWMEDAWNWFDDNVIQPVVNFFEDVKEDFDNYDEKNEDEETVFESNYFSCYKGTFVLKTPFKASFSFGFIGLSTKQQNSNTLNHEYGHKVQLDNRGWGNYIVDIAVPSVTANILDRKGKLPYDYYGSAWEAEADRLGGVIRTKDNTPWPEGAYNSYWDLIKLFFK
jgi:RHS repeat-associated protein